MFPLNRLFRTVGTAFRRCVSRFPVTLAFALALAAYQMWLIDSSDRKIEDRLAVVLFYYLSRRARCCRYRYTCGRKRSKGGRRKSACKQRHKCCWPPMHSFSTTTPRGRKHWDIGIAHAAALLAIGLSLFFLSFFRERDDIPAWNFAQTAVGTLALTLIVGAVMSGGLCLLAFSLHQLFGAEVGYKCYLYMLVICSELLPLLMFLGLLPESEAKHDRQPQPTAFLQGAHPLPVPAFGGALSGSALRLCRHHHRPLAVCPTDGYRGWSWH